MKTPLLRLLLLLSIATSLGACSSAFDAKWQAAGRHVATDPYSGRWEGEWKSARGMRHHDQLQCIFSKQALAQGPHTHGPVKSIAYTADFHAHWHGLSSSYTVSFDTTRARDGLHFRGQQDLGKLQGGVYQYDGLVTPAKFLAHYESRYDGGVFELHRVPPAR